MVTGSNGFHSGTAHSRIPGKKYEPDFHVEARVQSTQTYLLRDFKLQLIRRTLRGISTRKEPASHEPRATP